MTVSISWAEANSTATPFWKWRTTRARMRPNVTGVPMAGRTSSSMAAPEREMSMILQL